MSSSLLSEPTRLRLSVSIATTEGSTPPSCARIEMISALWSRIRSSGVNMRKNGAPFDSGYVRRNASTRAIDNWPAVHAQPTIVPAAGDVHQQVKAPEALAALGRAIDDHEPGARNQVLHEIEARGRHQNVAESHKRKARRFLA